MKIHILQHVPFEGPANIAVWAARRKADVSITEFYKLGWKLPLPQSMDLLVVMGGPMGVNDEAQHPWLAEEKIFLKECIRLNRRILGVCLGAQLCADALGGKVYTNPQKEIGWFPVQTAPLHRYVADFPELMTVMHWHGDTFDLPVGAKHLGYSAACSNQMFVWHEQVLGLQYHLELAPEHIEALIKHCGDELSMHCDTVQPEEKIRSG